MTNSTILLGRILLSLDLRDFRILISWLTPITEPIGWHFGVENVIYSLILVINLIFLTKVTLICIAFEDAGLVVFRQW